ncbi:MAG: hypothetical protein HFJ80_06530 [Clostridiales bacterium]|nr:hypothetical protein [Clostridiales bacterium]
MAREQEAQTRRRGLWRTALPPDGISIFYTNTPTEEMEIYNDYVIPKALARTVVKDFVETGEMSACVDWEELQERTKVMKPAILSR